jgi:hypothetical protein
VLVFFLVSSLSPSQLWTLKTTEALDKPKLVSSFQTFLLYVALSIYSACRLRSSRLETAAMDSAYHPIYRFLVSIAAIGNVDERVDENSTFSALEAGS